MTERSAPGPRDHLSDSSHPSHPSDSSATAIPIELGTNDFMAEEVVFRRKP
jgi:hypothetical protein